MQQYCPPATKLALKSDKRYHVFLSFKGEDVRKTLVDHLFQALSAAGLNVFLDSEKLEKGEMIGLSLETAIECSAICIPIFSKGYADSSWCLREATAILKSPGLIIPLFYHVKPSHVRYPESDSSPYKQSFLKHYRHTGRHPREEIEWWKYALKQICPCLNFYVNSVRYQREEIDRWKHALRQICDHSGWSMEIDDGHEARLVKRVVNDLIRTLGRVPLQVAKHPVGTDSLKKVLIQKLNLNSVDEVVIVGIWGIGGIGKTTVAKALYNQLYADFDVASFVSDVRATAAESIGLTNLQNQILKELTNYDAVVYSVDHGISLFRDRLGGKRVLLILDDVDAVKQLNALVGDWLDSGSRVIITSRDKHILNVAQVSSECIHEISGLDKSEGLQLFSWHAFLKGSPDVCYEELSQKIVEACKGHPLSLEVIGSFLYDKQNDAGCWMEALHNIILNPDIYERLYISYNALNDEEKQIFVQIACFFVGERKTRPILFWKSFYRMVETAVTNLSLKSLIKIDEGGVFHMHDLLRDMGRTIAEKENTQLSQLQHLDLEGCFSLNILPDFIGNLSQLQNLNLGSCIKLNKLPHTIGNLSLLQQFNLGGCFWLENLPDAIGNLSRLHRLDLGGCSSLNNLPNTIGNLSQLSYLDLGRCTNLYNLPDAIGNLSQLQHLYLTMCSRLNKLSNTIGNLSQLQNLDLGGCSNLNKLPDTIGNLSQLQQLKLAGCSRLNNLPDTIGNLSQLQYFDLGGCSSLCNLPDTIGNLSQLQHLNLGWCFKLNNLPDTIGKLSRLQHLNLVWCFKLSKLPDTIGNLSQLQHLDLGGCSRLNNFLDTIANLSHLQFLCLVECKNLNWEGCTCLIKCP